MTMINNFIDSRSVRWSLLVAWMIFLTILLLQAESQPVIFFGFRQGMPTPLAIAGHFSTFAISALLWAWTLNAHFNLMQALKVTIIFLLIYGISTELAQSFSPGRSPNIYDLLFNTIGIAVGSAIYYLRMR